MTTGKPLNKSQLLHIIENPTEPVEKEIITQLEELIKEYPYFQGGHILLARAYFIAGNVFADKKIKKAAIYTSNRKKLKTFVNQPTPELKEEKALDSPVEVKTETKVTETIVDKTIPETKEETTTKEDAITPEVKAIESNTVPTQVPPIEDKEKTELEETLAQLKKLREDSSKILAEEIKPKKKATSKKTAKEVPSKKKETKTKGLDKKPVASKKKATPKKEAKPKKAASKSDVTNSRLGDVVFENTNDQTSESNEDNSADLLLKYLEHTRAKKRVKKQPKKDQLDIIDSFIKKDPSISRIGSKTTPTETSNDLSQSSTVENFNIITENMALLHARQGNISRSISIYEELILKYPQKKSYFASQIEKLKN